MLKYQDKIKTVTENEIFKKCKKNEQDGIKEVTLKQNDGDFTKVKNKSMGKRDKRRQRKRYNREEWISKYKERKLKERGKKVKKLVSAKRIITGKQQKERNILVRKEKGQS